MGHDLSADTWTVLDTNSATDVDILLIYALYHAADVWQTPEYRDGRSTYGTLNA